MIICNHLVKAEILFSRKCNLKCSYCAMANGKENTLTVEQWKHGLLELKALGCRFAAFYGAEPLLEYQKLKEILPYAEHIGIQTTLITNGVFVNTKPMLMDLYKRGMTSLSMSYDPETLDNFSKAKTEKAIETLLFFKGLGSFVRDVAAIATLTSKNYMYLPEMVRRMSNLGIWTFYDLYHFDRRQEGSKVSIIDPTLSFQNFDMENLFEVLEEVQKMKEKGYMVHANRPYIRTIKTSFEKNSNMYCWNCADYDQFPSWITIDCDGTVYPCDDFQPKTEYPYKINNLQDTFKDFCTEMKFLTKTGCPGCAWSTHIQAHAIKAGSMKMSDYVHGGSK